MKVFEFVHPLLSRNCGFKGFLDFSDEYYKDPFGYFMKYHVFKAVISADPEDSPLLVPRDIIFVAFEILLALYEDDREVKDIAVGRCQEMTMSAE